jgi:ABC-type oligopeptide transport system ATPase subunit
VLDGAKGGLALVVNKLTKRFGQRTAFSDVSFQVAYGEVFGFLGPNGAGKTTTVRTLGTLIVPTWGTAIVAGIPLSPDNDVEIRRRISIMAESPGLYLRLTVTENLEYFAGLYGLKEPGPRIRDAREAVNLGDRAEDLCGGLSKGLRQRVDLVKRGDSGGVRTRADRPRSGVTKLGRRCRHRARRIASVRLDEVRQRHFLRVSVPSIVMPAARKPSRPRASSLPGREVATRSRHKSRGSARNGGEALTHDDKVSNKRQRLRPYAFARSFPLTLGAVIVGRSMCRR